MLCLDDAVTSVIEEGYTHHIPRLMVLRTSRPCSASIPGRPRIGSGRCSPMPMIGWSSRMCSQWAPTQ